MQNISILILSLITSAFAAGASVYFYFIYAKAPVLPDLSASIQPESIKIEGLQRSYLSYVPKKLAAKPALIIVLHGSGIDGQKIRQWTGYEFDEMADLYGYAVAYPDGYKKNWNDTRKDAPFPAKKENINDVGFIAELIKTYEMRYGIDPKQVYVFGYSNGGQMAMRLAIETTLVNAIAVISASLPTPDNLICKVGGPTARVMLVNGTSDKINPYDGGEVALLFGIQKFGTAQSSQATAEHFASWNGISNPSVLSRLPHQRRNDPTSVSKQVWLKEDTHVVELFTINGGGHVIPQLKASFPRLMGKVTKDLDAPIKALEFFGLIGHEQTLT
jgi:polyhydroxybutyrate depolymerase